MKKFLALLPILLGLTLFYSCNSGAARQKAGDATAEGPVPTAITKPIPDTKPASGPGIRDLNPDEFNKIRDENPDAIVLDVRTPGEFAQSNIEGAINIDVNNPNFSQNISSLDKNKTYLVYCRSGRRSVSACQIMEDQGFNNLYNLKGGIIKWQAEK